MAEVVLFHHAQGLTEGVQFFADQLRAARHTVHTPDAYDGHTFDTLEEGIGYAKETGFEAVVERSLRAAQDLPAEVVHIGMSLGVMAAQQLAQNRPGARGAVLLESCVPPSEFGSGWPAEVPVQVHGGEQDPVFAGEGDLDAARELVEEAEDGQLYLYPVDRHLFVDSSLSTYDAEATRVLLERVTGFLARL
jgi:dienelactone hydrolase